MACGKCSSAKRHIHNLAFLAEGGWLILLTTSAVESEGYAAQLRADLLNFWVEQVDFFPKLQLFGKYVGVTNTIFQVQKRPEPNPNVRRRLHRSVTLDAYEERPIAQTQGPEVLFRINYRPPPAGVTTCCIPLCAIAYIGTGCHKKSAAYKRCANTQCSSRATRSSTASPKPSICAMSSP
ncbi:hypothetical protein [Candidatus Viridilinea mediisalina]|uniref:hypothetical protein n=1 Tax=Candidatus Viridilinea mediisalina TaxID=2024553 RepID=UPI000F5A6FD4|nr:hypothetical protein [Candidatus Viridilinea mediisalina]